MGKKKDKQKTPDQQMREYLRKYSPLKPQKPIRFDLRGYHRYLVEHNLDGRDVPEEISRQFFLDDEDEKLDTTEEAD